MSTEKAGSLDDIALGNATPASARAILAEALRACGPGDARQVYAALRAWTWKALDGRRRDAELRDWYDILRRTAAFLGPRDAGLAQRVAALHELLGESIAVSERIPEEDLLGRRQVRDMLAMLAASDGGCLARTEVGVGLGLARETLPRLLAMVSAGGLVECVEEGGVSLVRLTRSGREKASEPDAGA